MEVERGAAFEHCFESGIAGQLGTVSLTLIDNDGGIYWSADTTDIVETPAGTGIYCANRTAPIVVGHYTLVWSIDGTYDDSSVSIDDLFVLATSSTGVPLTPGESGGPQVGPCFAWVAVEDVALCCSVEVGSDYEVFEDAVTSASQLLYMLSGRQWTGSCDRTVRAGTDWPCGLQVLSRGHLVGWDGTFTAPRVLLPNYPVTEILEVKINGDVLDEDEYRLDGWRWLTRMADADGKAQSWPAWGRLDRESTEDNTFEITYSFGQNPPQPGIDAAAELACDIYKACPGNEGVGECKLPKNAVTVTRSGITINLGAINYSAKERRWTTGLKLVDHFLNAFNPDGVRQRPLIWSPDGPQHAVEVGTSLGS